MEDMPGKRITGVLATEQSSTKPATYRRPERVKGLGQLLHAESVQHEN